MQEVLTRRIHNDWPKADLWVVDGGRGQLGVALEVKKKFKLSVPVVALAKDRRDKNGEKIFIPKKSDPIMLPEGSSALLLIQRLRDEAHRFAITYHRDVRSRGLF
jgi:excinuclease ABC subunit C